MSDQTKTQSQSRQSKGGKKAQLITASISDPQQFQRSQQQLQSLQAGDVKGLEAVMHLSTSDQFVELQIWESEQALSAGQNSPAIQQRSSQMRSAFGASPSTKTYDVENESYPS